MTDPELANMTETVIFLFANFELLLDVILCQGLDHLRQCVGHFRQVTFQTRYDLYTLGRDVLIKLLSLILGLCHEK